MESMESMESHKAGLPHPSHTLWESRWDSHIPTASTPSEVFRNKSQDQSKTKTKP
jgi:hypothetical protein